MSCGPRPECRDQQLSQLSQLLPPSGSLPECLLAQGVGGTGKTLTLKWFLANSGLAHAFVHCVEVYQPRLLFQSVLEQLAGPDREVGRCDNLSDFLTELALCVGQKGAVLVLEGGERLREEGSLLHVLLRLQEMTGSNVCTVVESRLAWCKFLPPQDLGTSPLTLHFGQYAREELARLVGGLLAKEGGQWEESFLQTYAGMVLSVFFNVTRSLTEMLHIARLNLPAYTGPVVRGECGEKDNRKLWFNIEPELKRCLSTVHLREVASQQLLARSKTEETQELSIPGSASAGRISVELPFYSKFLLISAFLASYNPAKTDKRFFVKHHGKQRNSSAKIKSKERMNSQLTGPKPFPLERLLAIFYNIVEEKVNPTANIYSQLSSLVRLQLLTAVGLDMMDQPKYKCNVSLEFIRTIGKPMQFDIYKYLYDHN